MIAMEEQITDTQRLEFLLKKCSFQQCSDGKYHLYLPSGGTHLGFTESDDRRRALDIAIAKERSK